MPKNNMSAEGRARIAAAQKKRWEAKRAAKLAKAAETAMDVQPIEPVHDAVNEPETVNTPAVAPEIEDLGSIPSNEEVNKHTRCTSCGWEISNKTFLEAITAHEEFHKRKGSECRPRLVHPTDKFLKMELLTKLKNNPRSVQI